MNGLTKQEQSLANSYNSFNRKFVRAILRCIRGKCWICGEIYPSSENLIIFSKKDDSFEIKVTMMHAENGYRAYIEINTTLNFGISKQEYRKFVQIKNKISDLAFNLIKK